MKAEAFLRYARYYDLLNREKDYAGEAQFADRLLRPAGTPARTLLDIGCGTGGHAREFARLGWRVTGIDLSTPMIEIAQAKTAADMAVEFVAAAADEFDLGQTFAAAVSLFHVVSYQSGPGQAFRMFANVRRHLAPAGIFVFDFWHGPGVLADPPVVRTRRAEDEGIRVTRVAKPAHNPLQCLVEINYKIDIEDLGLGTTERIGETHRMRYFFLPELEFMLGQAGFSIEALHAGLSERSLDRAAWYGLVVARAC